MTGFKVLLKFSLTVFILLMLTNVESTILIDATDNCLTCTEYPPNNTSSPTSSPALALPICHNCSDLDCSAVPEGTTFPYVNHCKLYYKCVNRVAVTCTCANGYWYERNGKQCELCPMVTNCPANLD